VPQGRLGSTFAQVMALWPEVCKTVGLAYPGSNPGPATTSGDPLELARCSSRLILLRVAVCRRRCPYAGRRVKYVPKFGGSAPDHLLVVPRPCGFLDAALGFVLLAGDALGVAQEPLGHAQALSPNGVLAVTAGEPGQGGAALLTPPPQAQSCHRLTP